MSEGAFDGQERSPAEQVDYLILLDFLPLELREALLALRQQSSALPAFDRSLASADLPPNLVEE